MSGVREELINTPPDMHESPVMPAEINGYELLPLGELVVAVARYRLKGFRHHGDASEQVMWTRARDEAKGE